MFISRNKAKDEITTFMTIIITSSKETPKKFN